MFLHLSLGSATAQQQLLSQLTPGWQAATTTEGPAAETEAGAGVGAGMGARAISSLEQLHLGASQQLAVTLCSAVAMVNGVLHNARATHSTTDAVDTRAQRDQQPQQAHPTQHAQQDAQQAQHVADQLEAGAASWVDCMLRVRAHLHLQDPYLYTWGSCLQGPITSQLHMLCASFYFDTGQAHHPDLKSACPRFSPITSQVHM